MTPLHLEIDYLSSIVQKREKLYHNALFRLEQSLGKLYKAKVKKAIKQHKIDKGSFVTYNNFDYIVDAVLFIPSSKLSQEGQVVLLLHKVTALKRRLPMQVERVKIELVKVK